MAVADDVDGALRDAMLGAVAAMPHLGHHHGMGRARVSTTVDEELLAHARRVSGGKPDAALLDAALRSFLARHRAAEIDASYAAYDSCPLDEPDEWGDVASFRAAAAIS